MYKVFFNQTELFLRDGEGGDFQEDNLKEITYSKVQELKDIIDAIIKRNEHEKLLITPLSGKSAMEDLKTVVKDIKAAGGVIINPDKEVLIIYRRGRWDLPKGKCHRGESMEECAYREIEEECGIVDFKISHLLATTYHLYPNDDNIFLKETYWYLMNYHGNAEPVPQTEESITEVKWFNKNDLDIVKSNTYLSIIDVLEKSLGYF